MSLELNTRKWWECSGDELWAMNLRRPNFVAQDDECYRRTGNQALSKLILDHCKLTFPPIVPILLFSSWKQFFKKHTNKRCEYKKHKTSDNTLIKIFEN